MKKAIRTWSKHLLRRNLLALCIPLLVCSGCASWSTTGPGDATHASFVQPAHARIYFATRTGHPFPAPLLYVTVAGQATTMILDTGSPFNVLGSTIAAQLGLMLSAKRGRGFDAGGKRIHYKQVKSPQIKIENWDRLSKSPTVANRLPKMLDTFGIAGLLAPWRLAYRGQALNINFRNRQFSVVSHAMARVTLDIHSGDRIPLTAYPRTVTGMSYTMPAHINGAPVKLLVDTGSTRISVYADSAIGQKLTRLAGIMTTSVTMVSGQAEHQVVPDVTLQIGDVKKSVRLMLIQGEQGTHPRYDGVVGMSYLKTCILVLKPKRGTALCK